MSIPANENTALQEDNDWSQVISPKVGLLDLRLTEVWHYRDLLWLFVRRDFVAAYKQTVFGPLWHFIQPVFTTIMFLLVFGKIANIPTDGIEPIVFYMSGITIWNYFSTSLTSTAGTFSANASIFGKVYFPRLIIPLSTIISNLVKFGIQLVLLFAAMAWYGFHGKNIHFGFSWLLIIPVVVLMALTGLGLGIIISSLTTKYRDFNVLIGFGVQLLMYLTPIAYPLSFLSGKSYAKWVYYNPLTPLTELFRYALFGKGSFSIESLCYSGAFTLIALSIGLILFNKVEKSFMDTV